MQEGFARKTTGDFGYARGWELSEKNICYVAFDEDGVAELHKLVKVVLDSKSLPGQMRDRVRRLYISLQDIRAMMLAQRQFVEH
jgi:hypothetical protein